MAFHESFWLATSAAAPVIALAVVVALPGSLISVKAIAGLRLLRAVDLNRRAAELGGESEASSLADSAKSLGLERLTEEDLESIEELAEPGTSALYTSAKVNRLLSLGNLIIQAGLLAVSLAALAYDRDVIPPWAAIILAVGGILLLAWTSVAEATIRRLSEY